MQSQAEEIVGLATALSAPDGALLMSDHGEIMLLVTSHAHPDRVTIERYRMGSPVAVADVVKLLDSLGLLLRKQEEPAAPAVVVVEPVVPAIAPDLCCPECGKHVKNNRSLGQHRKMSHGVPGRSAEKDRERYARKQDKAAPAIAPEPEAQPVLPAIAAGLPGRVVDSSDPVKCGCGRAYVTAGALQSHVNRDHSGVEPTEGHPEYQSFSFVQDGRPLTGQEAIAKFRKEHAA